MQEVTGRVATSLHGEAGDTAAGTDLGSLAAVQPRQAHLAFLPLPGDRSRSDPSGAQSDPPGATV